MAYMTQVHKFSKNIKSIQNYGSHIFHTENPQISDATVQNSVARATRRP
jgi:UDP-galactopyranose mutase